MSQPREPLTPAEILKRMAAADYIGITPEGRLALKAGAAALHREAEEIARLTAELDSWKAGRQADATGHMFRCAKVNGQWNCVKGCAIQRAEQAEAQLASLPREAGPGLTVERLVGEDAEARYLLHQAKAKALCRHTVMTVIGDQRDAQRCDDCGFTWEFPTAKGSSPYVQAIDALIATVRAESDADMKAIEVTHAALARDYNTAIERVKQLAAVRASAPASRETTDGVEQPEQVTRFEVIDNNGRAYTSPGASIELHYQDEGRTLKVFVGGLPAAPPETGTP